MTKCMGYYMYIPFIVQIKVLQYDRAEQRRKDKIKEVEEKGEITHHVSVDMQVVLRGDSS